MPASEFTSVTFKGDAPGPHLLITAGVHGDEFESIFAVQRLIEVLSKRHQETRLLRGQVTLIPCVNEDAFWRGKRCASDGLDLARTCPGNPDGSITQRTAHTLSDLICRVDYYIDLHTGGTEFSIFPLAGYMLHPDQTVLAKQRQMARAFGLPVIWGTSPQHDGRTLSVARDAHIPSIYCEYGGAAICQSNGIAAYVTGCLNVLAEFKLIAPRTSDNVVKYIVEDHREGSGHLQVCNPSPVNGLFEAEVKLGEVIEKGALLGRVLKLSDRTKHEMRSPHSGVVLMLRTFPRVKAGESVGVVLKLEETLQHDS